MSNNKRKLHKFGEFTKNESLDKFPFKKSKKKDTTEKPQGLDRDGNLSYNVETNRRILAKEKGMDYSDKHTNIDSTKKEIPTVDPNIYPDETKKDASKGIVNLDEEDTKKTSKKTSKTNENEDVEFYGKIAKFPKDIEASKAINFMEKVKLSKNKIWYVMVEKQDNELQMVKYAMKKGVNLSKFVNELKKYYVELYKDNEQVLEKVSNIKLAGDKEGNYSAITNIPSVEVEGKKMITHITEDLIKLLSK